MYRVTSSKGRIQSILKAFVSSFESSSRKRCNLRAVVWQVRRPVLFWPPRLQKQRHHVRFDRECWFGRRCGDEDGSALWCFRRKQEMRWCWQRHQPAELLVEQLGRQPDVCWFKLLDQPAATEMPTSHTRLKLGRLRVWTCRTVKMKQGVAEREHEHSASLLEVKTWKRKTASWPTISTQAKTIRQFRIKLHVSIWTGCLITNTSRDPAALDLQAKVCLKLVCWSQFTWFTGVNHVQLAQR